MRKFFTFFSLLVLGVVLGSAQTPATVTGVIFDQSGSPATSGYVEFDLQPQNGGIQFYVSGLGVIAPQSVQCGIDGSGNVKNLALSGACLIWGNNNILPGNTTYTIQYAPGGVVQNTVAQHCITGSSYNLASPVFCPRIALQPQSVVINPSTVNQNILPVADAVFNLGSQTNRYAGVFAANGTFTNLTLINNLTAVSLTLSGNATVGGTLGVTGAVTASGGGTLSGSWVNNGTLNNIWMAANASNFVSDIPLACNGTTPGTVWAPLGITTGVAAFTIPSQCSIKCPSPGMCKITAANNYGTNFIFTSGTNVSIEGMFIDCNNGTQSGAGMCIRATAPTNFTLKNSTVQNAKANLFFVDGVGGSRIWVVDNIFSGTTGGNGVIIGNTPASQLGADVSVSDIHIRGNSIHNINGTSDGIFTIGEVASTGYGIVGGDITGNFIDTFPDTGIEVGEGSTNIEVGHNFINIPPTVAGGVGIATRSAQNITVSANTVTCTSPAVIQKGIFTWHCTGGSCSSNAVSDPPNNQFINIYGNIVNGCAAGAAGSHDYEFNSGNNINAGLNQSSNVAASYLYGGTITNLSHCFNDDMQCVSNNGNNIFFDPGSGKNVQVGRALAVNPAGGAVTPPAGASIYINEGGNANALTIEATNNANTGINVKNTLQSWGCWDIRAAAGGLVATNESIVCRDITGGNDVVAIAPSTGVQQWLGTLGKYNNRATTSNGISATYGADDKTAQSTSIGAVTLLTGGASTSGHYRVFGLMACTATDASGATVTLTANWTQDGIARSATSSAMGVNATTNSLPISIPIFVDASTNVTYSTTVTGAPTTGRYSVHIWLSQE